LPSRTQRSFFQEKSGDIEALARNFSGYATNIDEYSIRSWLAQFDDNHLDVGLKLLKHVEFYKQPRVVHELQVLHETLEQINDNQREMIFCAFGQAGKSGDSLLHTYRIANHIPTLSSFIHLTDLPDYVEREDLMLVFVDDFIGTGDQALKLWEKIQGVINEENQVYLMVLCATDNGIRHVEEGTRGRLSVVYNTVLHEDSKLFSDSNIKFTSEEKAILRDYCMKAGSDPEGYGKSQLALIFYYRAPDNVISILRCDTKWKGLFPRNP